MSVPSTSCNAAHCCCRPQRSSAQPWRVEKSRVSMLPSDLACLDTGNRIMRAVIKLSRQCHRHNVPWAIENPDKSFCWMTSLLEELSNVRNVHEMTSDICAFGIKWRKNATVLAGHVDSADVWALNRMRCYGRTRCTVTNEKHMQVVGYDFSRQCARVNKAKTYPTAVVDTSDAPLPMSNACNAAGYDPIHQCSRTSRGKSYPTRLASRLASLLLGPPSPPECREHAMIWACEGTDDTPCCAESSLRRV